MHETQNNKKNTMLSIATYVSQIWKQNSLKFIDVVLKQVKGKLMLQASHILKEKEIPKI